MAGVVLPVIGAAAGFVIGGPQGALIGFGIGAQLGGTFGSDQTINLPTVEGPRLSDLRIQTSNYGKVIPEVYGQARLAGNVIWARPIKEVRVETTTTSTQQGGKGGGGGSATTTQTQVSYEYFVTLAIAVCEGPLDEITRVYADAKILDDSVLQASQGKYSVYLGTETQTPDPVMEGFEGAGNVPAYRGLAYVVIQDFPLAAYGNRIPNFSFEVKRNIRFTPAVEDKVTDLVLIPGAGEFVYSPSIIYKQNTEMAGMQVVPSGPKVPLNMHNFDATANVNVAVDQLKKTFPNLEWIALVVSWFATSTDAGTCTIIPKVENPASTTTFTPQDWSVAGLTRASAQQVLQFGDGTPTYGGTPSDQSVLDLCVKLKAMGLKVMLYPMIFLDQITPDPKPWRGRIAPANTTDCNNWFTKTNGYNAFITHYANLNIGGVFLKNNLDAFVMGSELIGMTNFTPSAGSYPAVTQLVSLASTVKTAVGAGVKVTYAADWSEYHHAPGGWYNMDPLWASSSIDFVGIDAYFALTPDLPQSQITEDVIKEYWEKGEDWDYFWNSTRTVQTSFGGNPAFAVKNLEYWWANTHTNPGGAGTAWTAKMKPVWFTEFGFPSVDGCTNQPNVFYDPSSAESFFPRGSKGRVDFQAQRIALNATLDYLAARNAQAGKSGLVPRRFIWTADARPYPFWPDLANVWADSGLWRTGHWVQGKLGTSTLGAVIALFMRRVGYQSTDYDVTRLTQSLDGYVVTQILTCRQRIEHLQAMYNFDAVESDGLTKFVPRGGQSIATITQDELVPGKSGNTREQMEITRKQELDLPREVNITYISRTANYDPGTQLSQRQTVKATDIVGINVPVVATDQYAKSVADITLYNAWTARVSFSLTVPPQYSRIEPTDNITISIDGVNYLMRVTSTKIERNGLMEISAVAEDVSTYDFYTPPGVTPPISQPGTLIPGTRLELIDIPALPNDTDPAGILRAGVVAQGENWQGAVIYRSDDGGETGGNTFLVLSASNTEHTIGGALTVLPPGPTGNLWDYGSTVDVLLQHGSLASISELGVLNGGNVALLGNEIIQFANAQLLADQKYRLSSLLRGRLGTEHEQTTHALGERFVLLNANLMRVVLQNSLIGLARHYKPVTIGGTLATTPEQVFTYTGKTLRPYSPVHIQGTRHAPVANDWTITWVRRTRLGGEWRDGVDVPLNEQSELYHVQIMNGLTVVRTVEGIITPSLIYTAAQQVADFGAAQTTLSIKIYQVSAIVGRGVPGIATIS